MTFPDQSPAAAAVSGAALRAPVSRLEQLEKPSLVGATRAEIAEACRSIGVPEREIKMRTAQLWHWIYFQGATSFEVMLNIGKALRSRLAESFSLARPEVVSRTGLAGRHAQMAAAVSADRSEPSDRGAEVECVYIPETDRGTLCISSQVGCTLTCSFCHTGTQKPRPQSLGARDRRAAHRGARKARRFSRPDAADRRAAAACAKAARVSNIVFMGMGEPLYNFENVRDAVGVLSDGDGLALSKRRITVSTAGVVPQIERLGAEASPMLAISLHAVSDELRDKLVPLNKKYPSEGIARGLPRPIPASRMRGASPSNM